ncbi:MAG: hypothetical protein ABW034_03120 [Steroidobacteraceae bacterium]
MSSLMTIRTFELIVATAFFAAILWACKLRNPLYLGALIGGAFCFVFDWAWCARSFFNATFHADLIPLPGIEVMGLAYPLVLPPAWGLAYGLTTILLVRVWPSIERRVGKAGYVLVWLAGGIAMTAVENLLVGVLHIYTYHQKPEYLIGTVPWSNLLLSGNLQLLCFAGLRAFQKWAALAPNPGIDLRSENTWKGLAMGAMPLWGAFVITYAIQLFWYGAVEPWTESGRPF